MPLFRSILSHDLDCELLPIGRIKIVNSQSRIPNSTATFAEIPRGLARTSRGFLTFRVPIPTRVCRDTPRHLINLQ